MHFGVFDLIYFTSVSRYILQHSNIILGMMQIFIDLNFIYTRLYSPI